MIHTQIKLIWFLTWKQKLLFVNKFFHSFECSFLKTVKCWWHTIKPSTLTKQKTSSKYCSNFFFGLFSYSEVKYSIQISELFQKMTISAVDLKKIAVNQAHVSKSQIRMNDSYITDLVLDMMWRLSCYLLYPYLN